MRTLTLFVLAAVTALAAPVPKLAKKKDDAKALEGRWESVTVEIGGGGARADTTWWLEVKDGKLSTGSGGSNGYVGRTIKLDPDATPKHLDIDDLSGHFILSIYKLEDDTLTWCESSSTTNRAADFQTAGGFNVFVFKRAKAK